MKGLGKLTAGALLALVLGASAAGQNNMAACSSASRKDSPEDQIRLYTICIEEGGLSAGNRAGAYNNRAAAYMQIGDFDKALSDLDRSIRYDPEWGVAYLNRGRIRAQRGELDAAEADFTQATTLPPARNRGEAFRLRGSLRQAREDYAGALSDYREAVDRERRNAFFLNSLAWLLATCPDDSIRNGAEAVERAERALRFEDNPAVRDTLAAAYAEAGRFEDAAHEQAQALAMLPEEAVGARAAFEARLALYREGQPYREP